MPLALLPLLLATAAPAAPAKIEMLPVTAKHLAYDADARIVHALRWRDRLGDHTLLLAETGERPAADKEYTAAEGFRDASLYAYEYLEAGGRTTRVWKLEDHVTTCPVDLDVTFVPGSTTLTDLDADGEAEVTFQYSMSCNGGVDPAGRKLILREGKAKYAIRGTNRSPLFEAEYVSREPDPAFKDAPPAFLKHALEQWEAFVEYGAVQP